MSTVYTIGHSSHSFGEFLGLLKSHEMDVVVDTRSAPYSRFAPQFDREILQRELVKVGRQVSFSWR